MAKYQIVICCVLLSSAICSADVVPVTWVTSGVFSPVLDGLSYDTSSGSANMESSGKLSKMDLGTFSLSSLHSTQVGTFTLNITFSRPDTTFGNSTYTTTYIGASTIFGDAAILNFDNTWRTFHFDGSDGTGSFDFRITPTSNYTFDPEIDIYVSCLFGRDPTDTLYGEIQNVAFTPLAIPAQVPEAASVPLFLVVAAGALLALRKRTLAQ